MAVTDMAMLMVIGGILVAIGTLPGYWIGRASNDQGGIQARETVRELQSLVHQRKRQLAAAREVVGQLILHPAAAGHVRVVLVDKLKPLLEERAPARPPERRWNPFR